MKILLVKPYNLPDHIQPALGLGYLATVCRKKHEVVIIDCIKENLKADGLLKRIQRENPDFVGFQCLTYDLKFIKEALAACKNFRKSIYTAIGGVHPSAVPEESFSYFKNDLDFIFIGEAETGLPLLLEKLEGNTGIDYFQIPGLAWRGDSSIHKNNRYFIEDLDEIGMPAWDLIQPEEYPQSQHGAFFKNFPIAPVMATRGCPFSCTFCAGSVVTGKKIRKHTSQFMIRQLRHLYDVHGIREFHMVDDNFTFDKAYAKEFTGDLLSSKLGMSWSVPNGVRLDTLDEELLDLMRKCGLYLISIGVESGSDRFLELMKKNMTVEEIKNGIRRINNFGINVAGFFILGFPGETERDIMKTIRLSTELRLVRANYFTYLPFPGTESYRELVKNKELDRIDWDNFYFTNAAYTPKGMTRRRLRNLQRLAFLRFFLRPRILWKNLLGIKSFRHFMFLLRRFFRWLISK